MSEWWLLTSLSCSMILYWGKNGLLIPDVFIGCLFLVFGFRTFWLALFFFFSSFLSMFLSCTRGFCVGKQMDSSFLMFSLVVFFCIFVVSSFSSFLSLSSSLSFVRILVLFYLNREPYYLQFYGRLHYTYTCTKTRHNTLRSVVGRRRAKRMWVKLTTFIPIAYCLLGNKYYQ